VAGQLADSGGFEACAPTMLGHHGGHRSPTWLLDTGALVDDVERRMDRLGWQTAHIVGNSLGGWVAFELERRGRARTLTAIAPAGGWSQHSAAKYETVLKFILGGPALIAARLLGPRILGAPTHLVVCERDRVFPAPRGHRYFLKHMPATVEMIELDGLGHIPMLEAPTRVADVITDFITRHTTPQEKAAG